MKRSSKVAFFVAVVAVGIATLTFAARQQAAASDRHLAGVPHGFASAKHTGQVFPAQR